MMIEKAALSVLLAGAFVVGMSSTSHAVSLIDTTGAWNGIDAIAPFGEPHTSTYGQTFTVTGSETVLDDFTFYIDDRLDPDFVDFEAYVYAWDGNSATGSALYAGSPLSTTNNGGFDGFEAFTINTGGINLVSGNQYVAFFTSSNLFDGLQGTSSWGGLGGADVYAGGQFVFRNNVDDFDLLFTSPWTQDWLGAGSDLAFTMNFSNAAPIPEPGTMTLLGLGLAGLVARSRRGKKQAS